MEFNQELATLLKAGMPLVQSLDLLRTGVKDQVFRPVLDGVYEQVKAGTALSDAFEAHGDLFPRVYTASLMAGERSGNLEVVLRRYVAYAKLIGAVRRKTLSALMYPTVLVGVAIAVVSIIVLKLVPAFSTFYGSFGAELPYATRLIVTGSTFLSRNIFVVLAALGAAGVAGYTGCGGPARETASTSGCSPCRSSETSPASSRFRSWRGRLSTLLGGGIPLVNALDVAARSVSNRFIARELVGMAQGVREGQSLADTMRVRTVFPDVAIKMTEVGEATGALQDMLTSLAEFYDEEVETKLDRFVTLVEPVLLITMGIVIAGLLLALYLPLFQLSSVVS